MANGATLSKPQASAPVDAIKALQAIATVRDSAPEKSDSEHLDAVIFLAKVVVAKLPGVA
jgi:hypothetical protein